MIKVDSLWESKQILEAMILLCKAIVQAILLTTLLPQTISPLMKE